MMKITTLAVMLVFIMLITAPGSCRRTQEGETDPVEETTGKEEAATDTYRSERMRMVRDQIAARGISDPLVLAAMRKVPRHEFVLPESRGLAYADTPLPIGMDQTISQPYIVAYMTELAGLKGGDRVLEVGTGSGYQAAVLAEICKEVYTIEILCPLAEGATKTLKRLDYSNVTVKCGDGYQGWKAHEPFDAVIVTAAADHIPEPLIRQLRVGGRLIMPVGGTFFQEMIRLTRTPSGVEREKLIPVRFVPLTGPLKEVEEPEVKEPSKRDGGGEEGGK